MGTQNSVVEKGLLHEQQLKEALNIQKETGRGLIHILLELGYYDRNQIGYASVLNRKIDENVLKIVPVNIIKKYKAIPLELRGNLLRVAMVDPLNLIALDDLYLASGCEIEPLMTNEDEFERAFNRYYGLWELDSVSVKEDNMILEEKNSSYNEKTNDGSEIDEAPIIRAVNSIIRQGIKMKSSDIHLEPTETGLRIKYRVDGILLEDSSLDRSVQFLITSRVKILAGMDIAEKRLPQDGRISYSYEKQQIDLRVSTIPTIYGEKIVMRILDRSSMFLGLEALGMDSDILIIYKEILKTSSGMILYTGPTGSGKTTSLYATLKYLLEPTKNVVAIEDPVEYQLSGVNQICVNNKTGLSFSVGLKGILRQDPDIIMLGEIRELETAQVAIQASISGHLLLSTLHTNNAAGAITRLADMGIEPFLVSSAINAIIAQRLVRKICNKCKEGYIEKIDHKLKAIECKSSSGTQMYRGRGCFYCNNTGFKGRIAIFEVLHVTEEIKKLIMNKASTSEINAAAINLGMRTFKEDGIQKVLQGLTTFEEVNRVSFDICNL